VAIGLFAISEVLVLLEETHTGQSVTASVGKVFISIKEFLFALGSIIRGSLMGFFIGVLPGAGASTASFISYTMEKRISNRDDTFGKGDIRGVAGPESANNAAAGGALIPLITLGVPGSGTTAILLGALLGMNIVPGPLMFQNHPNVVWGLVASMYIGNVMLLILNLPLVGLFVKILLVPRWILIPLVTALSFIGVYSVNNSPFDILLMSGFGVLGYLMRKMDYPLAPVILGLVLGELMEKNLRRAMSISGGDWTYLFSSPITIILWIMAVISLFAPLIFTKLGELKKQAVSGEDEL
jgi:putative tricarboxylic transport membrane protein